MADEPLLDRARARSCHLAASAAAPCPDVRNREYVERNVPRFRRVSGFDRASTCGSLMAELGARNDCPKCGLQMCGCEP